ncbi:MAG: hypothetical protein R3F31_21575 [Verrucomicrobiales bacterium]
MESRPQAPGRSQGGLSIRGRTHPGLCDSLVLSGGNSSNFDLVRNYIEVYKQNFALIQEGDYKSGKVGDIEAAFQVLDFAILQGDNQVKYRFFLMVFPMGPDAYLIQSSTPLPVHDYRKKEILEIMRSVKVLKSPFD